MTAGEFMRMIQDRRRYHLRLLVAQAGSQREVARKVGMDQGQLSNIINGSLPFTEFRARKVEQFLSLAFGSLDKEAS